MAGPEDSQGHSADSQLTLEGRKANPFYNSDGEAPSPVWKHSDYIRDLLTKRAPDQDGVKTLLDALKDQLPTIVLYSRVVDFHSTLQHHTNPAKELKLYSISFPGEARDNTGIKDLNDKVIGYTLSSKYIELRRAEIEKLFNVNGDKFFLAGQNYKVAYVLTLECKREHFIARLKLLNDRLKEILLVDILPEAAKEARKLEDTQERDKRLQAIKDLQKALKKKNYQFDIYFGLAGRQFHNTAIETVFLLLTESLKAGGVARFAAKGETLPKIVNQFAVEKPDPPKDDSRGKEFVWTRFILASRQAVRLREFVFTPYNKDRRYDYNHIFVDTVWTVAFIQYKLRLFGNPDVIRDVRKKLLRRPQLAEGVKYTATAQKALLEFWLVVLNMLDFVKEFQLDEMRNTLVAYHEDALRVFNWLSVGPLVDTSYWPVLERLLTHDHRNVQIAVAGNGSEFQFYASAADATDWIFFSFDIRDLGVDLMLWYENSNELISHRALENIELLDETLRSTGPIVDQKRFTYEKIVAIFREYHKQIGVHHRPMMEKIEKEALQAFGKDMRDVVWQMPDFGKSVLIMVGGDEYFVAAHPGFSAAVPEIICRLDETRYRNRTLNMRAAIAYSRAERISDPQKQRENSQASHDQSMSLANAGAGPLKTLERTHRRVERLIEKLEANPKKKDKAPPYRKELDGLRLVKLFSRVKHGDPKVLSAADFRRMYRLLEIGDLAAAQKEKKIHIELLDCAGNLVDGKKLIGDAHKLEERVRFDVGLDNFNVDLPPGEKVPKIIDDILDDDKDRDDKRTT
jgi:hypothetical protein